MPIQTCVERETLTSTLSETRKMTEEAKSKLYHIQATMFGGEYDLANDPEPTCMMDELSIVRNNLVDLVALLNAMADQLC